jgi:chromosome segregation ATPase
MPDKAHVTSLDALDAFRANLIVYVSQARPALEEVAADVMRTRSWLENQQRSLWENQLRRRVKELERAQQSLFSARLGALRRETAADQMAVHRAKRAVEEAETKLRMIKKWLREFEGRVQPMVKQTEKLHTILTNDMVKAVAYLTQALDTLAAYAEIKPTAGMAIDTPPPSTNSTAVTTDPELGALVEHTSPGTPAKGGSQ